MHIIELSKQILREMWQRKLRSFLALFGIIWGTLSVILLLALGEGFYQASKDNMNGFVNGTLLINHGVTSKPFQGIPPGQSIHIHASDVIQLGKIIPNIQDISPVLLNNATITYQKQIVKTNTQATDANFAKMSNYQTQVGGRFIDNYDILNHRNVIYIGDDLKQNLFGGNDAIGKNVFINGIPFTVIGILKQLPEAGDWYNNTAIIPYTTAIDLFGDQDIAYFVTVAKDISATSQLQNNITHYLAWKFHFASDDPSAIWVFDFSVIQEFFTWFFRSIELFLGFCGAMTLGVGGLSVANIMFLIVLERTREIGLRLALGARRSHIMFQILLEASLIVFIGGFIGFLLAYFSVELLHHIHLPHWLGTPIISPLVVVTTILILLITALFAGYFPARRAANMQPVKALAF